eukprot:3579298-Rhodomonas_salina.1
MSGPELCDAATSFNLPLRSSLLAAIPEAKVTTLQNQRLSHTFSIQLAPGTWVWALDFAEQHLALRKICLLYTSPSPRDRG